MAKIDVVIKACVSPPPLKGQIRHHSTGELITADPANPKQFRELGNLHPTGSERIRAWRPADQIIRALGTSLLDNYMNDARCPARHDLGVLPE